MTILYVVDDYDSVSQTFVRREVDMMRAQGASLLVLSLHPTAPQGHPGDDHVSSPTRPEILRRLLLGLFKPQVLSLLVDAARHGRSARPLAEQAFALGVALYMVRQPAIFNHVHAHFFGRCADVAYYLHKLTGATFSATGHASEVFDPGQPRVLKRNSQAASFLVGESDLITETLLRVGGSKPAITIRSGLPRDRISSAPRSAPPPDQPLRVLTTARLVPKKGFTSILIAAQRLRDDGVNFRWDVLGDGPMRANLEAEVAARALSDVLILHGAQPNHVALTYLERAHVFVLPCIVQQDGESDGLPAALIEAVALGCPVVTTAVAAIPELIRHNLTGLLVRQHSGEDVAEAIQALARDPKLYISLSNGQLELARREYVLETEVERLRSLFPAH